MTAEPAAPKEESTALAALLTGAVDTKYGRTFVGEAVAQSLADRLLKAGYVPPTRFFITSDEALAQATQRGAKNAILQAINRLVEISERLP